MPKSIVLCADGAWDSPLRNSNVYQHFKSLVTISTQVSYYYDGVGSNGTPFEKLVGGAIGWRFYQKIKDGWSARRKLYQWS